MDISVLFKIAAIGIIITVICQILKKSDRDDIATLVSIVGFVIVLAVVVGMSLIISLLATVYPSYKASKTDPVEALRYE